MNDLNLVLRQVILHPEDDVVRLVYADLLQERNHSDGKWDDQYYAKFIRDEIDAVLFSGRSALVNEDREELRGGFMGLPAGMGGQSSRGFYFELTTDARTFLRHADELIWHPDQKVVCERCNGAGVLRMSRTYEIIGYCPECKELGSGKVPRPCPPTAQPVRRVVLTSWDDADSGALFLRFRVAADWPGGLLPRYAEMLGVVFPGVEFVLPWEAEDGRVGSASEHQSSP